MSSNRAAQIDNIWRHWWAGHMAAVGGRTRLPLSPLDFPELAAEPRMTIAATPRRKPKKNLANEIGDEVVGALDRLVLAPHELRPSLEKTGFMSGRRHLNNCDFNFHSTVIDRLEGGGRYYLVPREEKDRKDLTEMFWPVDVADLVTKDHDVLFASRIATVLPREIRGLVKLVPSKCVVYAYGSIPPTGEWSADALIAGFIGNKWQEISTLLATSRTDGIRGDTKRVVVTPHEDVDRQVSLFFSMQLTKRYDWHVALGRTMDGTRLLIPTNPRGCLELFRERNHAPGSARRAALRHWVNEHYRQRSNDDSQLDYVCEHLRGNTRFLWNGLACELLVSAYDMEKNEFFRRRAAEWRSGRKHNRVIVRLKR